MIIAQSRLRPIRSIVPTAGTVAGAPAGGNGQGVQYGNGIASARLAGISASWYDAAGIGFGAAQLVSRVAVLNGNYAGNEQLFGVATDLSQFDALFDALLYGPGPFSLPTWFSGIVSDAGQNLTALLSQLSFPGGAPANLLPQSVLLLHGDFYEFAELSLSPGIAK